MKLLQQLRKKFVKFSTKNPSSEEILNHAGIKSNQKRTPKHDVQAIRPTLYHAKITTLPPRDYAKNMDFPILYGL